MGTTRSRISFIMAITFGIMIALPTSTFGQQQGYVQQGYADPGQQADWAQPDASQMGVNMTLYHVVRGENGQQLMVMPSGQALPLPGAGVNGHRVAVYHGSHGGTWYVDQNGNQVDIPALEPSFYGSNMPTTAGGGSYAPVAPYYGPYGGNGYQNYYPPQESQQQAQQPPQATASATVNTGGNGGGGGGAMGSFAGSLIGSALGNAVGDLESGGIPYGAPVYAGGGGPYYYGGGGGGRRVVINNNDVNNQHFNEWRNQQNWYRNQFNQGGRFNHQSWPGKDHGFPPPWEGNNGRLYGGDGRRDGGEGRRDGGEGRRDGGEGRRDGGEGRHDGGGGEHPHPERGGGGEHHEGGGGHRGGGGHHGGGGGHRR